ncbi:MAG: putative lipoprotein YajG [Polaribacter sp.]|jgi:uncharacterized lipoprotein YajG
MNINRLLILLAIMANTFLFGCTSSKLIYQIDPDFSQLTPALENREIIYVEVTDNRNATTNTATLTSIDSDIPDSTALKSKLTQYLKDKQFKIINRPLLADIGIEIGIVELELSLDSGFFKSKITGKSELKIIFHKKSKQWSKTFKASRSQDIANPVNEFDATGIMNQMLSKQFNSIFSDGELIKFITK